MKKQTLVTLLVAFLFFILGIISSDRIKDVLQIKKCCKKCPKENIIDSNNVVINPNQTKSITISDLVSAHKYSVAHRIASGYCYPVKIDPNKEGYLTLSYSNAKDLVNTMETIRANYTTAVNDFNLIYGKNDATANSILMIVGLDPTGKEIITSPTGSSLIFQLTNSLPCPRYCDITSSSIIYYGGNPCK